MFTKLCALILFSGSLLAAKDPFAELVRPTEPLTPEEEAKAFQLPPGFSIELVASEPTINKPMNLAFDRKGQLWVTSSAEYPWAVKKEQWKTPDGHLESSRDKIVVFSDSNGDGLLDKPTVFADNLNIPTGVLPYKKGCIAWSIPNIWYLADNDGDGKCDERKILFGPLGWEKDTHGNLSSFRLAPDGWVYATHGFSNTTHIAVRPEHGGIPKEKRTKPTPSAENWPLGEENLDFGNSLDLHSGNVFRFKPDGSRVEPWAWGQVNPFGLTFDSYGNIYTADCHSNPLTQVIRGAYYPSFGKPHDGLGFGPVLCEHSHGSTGICGPLYFDSGVWGPEFDDNLLVCNPVTSRINRDKVTFTGATPKANELPDFLSTKDPWFRPVDIQLGPDGALYVADFYNRIIGHYEVPLTHPGRDRERGRLWRISKTGTTTTLAGKDVTKMDESQLRNALNSNNLGLRHHAIQEGIERKLTRHGHIYPDEADPFGSSIWLAHYLWNDVDGHGLGMGMRKAAPVRLAQLARVVTLTPQRYSSWNMVGIFDEKDARFAGQSIRSLVSDSQSHKMSSWLRYILGLLERCPQEDLSRRHILKIALRDLLHLPEGFKHLDSSNLKLGPLLAEIVRTMRTPEAAAWMLGYLEINPGDKAVLKDSLTPLARTLPADAESRLAAFVTTQFPDDLNTQLELFQAIRQGIAQRGNPTPATVSWGAALVSKLLEKAKENSEPDWTAVGRPYWKLEQRPITEGKEIPVLTSLPAPRGGEVERLTGSLRSKAFPCPEKLAFWLCGHRGNPGSAPHDRNVVRLVLQADGKVLQQAFPPRNDTAHRIEWDLKSHTGQSVRLELTDGDSGDAYAWLAVGGIEPPVVSLALGGAASLQLIAELVRELKLADHAGTLAATFSRDGLDDATRSAVAQAVASFPGKESLLLDMLKAAPTRLQAILAENLAGTAAGARLLITNANPRLLTAPAVATKIATLNQPDLNALVREKTASLPPANEAAAKTIAQRIAAYQASGGNAAEGQKVFATHCAICHKVGAEGQVVGPQLDGAGNRGLERLCEDILDPNRDVDPAFHLRILTLKNGQVQAGMQRRIEGESIVMADATARESTIAKADVAKEEIVPMSLMPAAFSESIPESDFRNLLAWLLGLKEAKP